MVFLPPHLAFQYRLQGNNSSILMAVLSFPVVISILLMAIKVTKNCIDGLDRSVSLD